MSPVVGQVALGLYALLLAVGGVMGFVKARSQPSLIAGLLSAVVAGGCVMMSSVNPPAGFGLGLLLALVLLGLFGRRYLKTRKFMPSGLLLAMSLVVALVLAGALAMA